MRRVQLTGKDCLLVIILLAGYIIIVLAGQLLATARLFVVGGVLLVILAGLILYIYRHLIAAMQFYDEQNRIRQNLAVQQMQAFEQIQHFVQPRGPLPAMRGMAISPDFGVFLVSQILRQKPRVIVELGCGVSTLVSAYSVERLGQGHLISFEHDAKYVDLCRADVQAHGLERFVTLHHAPLKEIELENRKWRYYDFEQNRDLPGIDLLIVDGPPAFFQPLIRYPALPLLYTRLNEGAVILIDDAGREDERRMLQQWQAGYPDLEYEFHDLEKGMALLRKSAIANVGSV